MLSKQEYAVLVDCDGLQPRSISLLGALTWTLVHSLLICSQEQKAAASKKPLLDSFTFIILQAWRCICINNDMNHENQWQKREKSYHKSLDVLCLHGCGGPPVIIPHKGIVFTAVHKLFHKGFLVCWLRVPRSKTTLVGPVHNLQREKQNELIEPCWHVMEWKPTAVWPLCISPLSTPQNCVFLLPFPLCSSLGQLHIIPWVRKRKLPALKCTHLPWQSSWSGQLKESSPLTTSTHTLKLLTYTVHPPVTPSRPIRFSVGVP